MYLGSGVSGGKKLLLELRERVVVGDGAMGTMLMALGAPAGGPPESLNVQVPKLVINVHRAYLDAGAEFIETNSFGGNRLKLGAFGLAEEAARLNRAAAKLARQAADEAAGRRGSAVWVGGSVGPTGRLFEPFGELSPVVAEEAYLEQMEALLAGGADAVIIETMSDLDEATAALRAARRAGSPATIVSMTFDRAGRTFMGVDGGTAARKLAAAGADVVGANCGNDIESLLMALREMERTIAAGTGAVDQAGPAGSVGAPPLLAAFPNAGVPQLVDGKTVYQMSPEAFAGKIVEFVEAGARLVGGCCGTTPEHIRRAARLLR